MIRTKFFALSLMTGIASISAVAHAEEAAPAADWSGPYAGVVVSNVVAGNGTYVYGGTPGDFYPASKAAVGLFAGYNLNAKPVVLGVEVSGQVTDYQLKDGTIAPGFTNMLEARARVGLPVGRALIYGFAGFSAGNWQNKNNLTNPYAKGSNVGGGLDYRLTKSTLVGVEYIHRDMSTEFNENNNGIKLKFGAVQLRVGMKF